MEEITITNRQLVDFLNTANSWRERNADAREWEKFHWAIHRVSKATEELARDYNKGIENINIDHCMEEKGRVVRDPNGIGGYGWTKAGLRSRNAAVEEFMVKEVRITPYMAKTVPPDLSPEEQRAFAGIIVPEFTDPEEEG